jgi:hypothetical protein
MHSRKRRALCRLLSLMLPNRIPRHLLPDTAPKTAPIAIGGPSVSREIHRLDVGSYNKRTSYAPFPQRQLLTVCRPRDNQHTS